MRRALTADRVRTLMRELAQRARGPGRVYLTGGTSAVLVGWREATVDADLKLDPEPAGVFKAIAEVKDRLQVNVELASPDLFIPPLPGWRERSVFIARHGEVDFYHYDFHAQALAKIERGHGRDLDDVRAMAVRRLVDPAEILRLYEEIEPRLLRYPRLDAVVFRRKVHDMVQELTDG